MKRGPLRRLAAAPWLWALGLAALLGACGPGTAVVGEPVGDALVEVSADATAGAAEVDADGAGGETDGFASDGDSDGDNGNDSSNDSASPDGDNGNDSSNDSASPDGDNGNDSSNDSASPDGDNDSDNDSDIDAAADSSAVQSDSAAPETDGNDAADAADDGDSVGLEIADTDDGDSGLEDVDAADDGTDLKVADAAADGIDLKVADAQPDSTAPDGTDAGDDSADAAAEVVDPNVCPYGLSPSLFCLKWGVCAQGVALACVGNSPVCDYTAVVGYQALEASCDGLDNDCNGLTDDDLPPPSAAAAKPGVCQGAKPQCAGAAGWQMAWAALPGYQATETACDGLDNDCDGQTDEMAPLPAPLQQGVCAGLLQSCGGKSGWIEPQYDLVLGYTEGSDGGCDGLDNDCDGQTDEDAACPLWQLGGSGSGRVSLAPDGSQLAWLSQSGVHAVDPASGKRYYDHFGHRWQVEAAAFSPDGLLLASVGKNDVLRVYPAAYGLGPPGTWPVAASVVLSGARWTALAFAPDGKAVVCGDDVGALRVFDLAKGAAQKPLPSHSKAVRAVTFAGLAQGQLAVVVSGADDGGVLARPWPGGSPWALAKLAAPIASLDADGHGRVLVVAPGVEARLLDVASGKTAAILQDSATAVAGRVVQSAAALWTVDAAGALRRWPLPPPGPLGPQAPLLQPAQVFAAPGLLPGDQAVDLAAGVTHVVVGAPRSGPQLLHLPSQTWGRPDGTGNVGQARLIAHPAGLLGAGSDGALRLWQPQQAKTLQALQAHDGALLSATWGPGWLLTGGSDFAVRLWQWPSDPSAAAQAPLNVKTFGLSGPWAEDLAAADATSAWAAAGPSVQRISAAAATAGQKLQVYAVGLGAQVQRVVPSPSGQRLLVALDGQGPAQGQHYRLIDSATLKTLWSRSDFPGQRHAAAWHPAGQWLALGGAGALHLVDADSGATLAPLPGWLGEPQAVAWNAQGTRLLAASSDGAARVWATLAAAPPQLRAVWTRHCPPPCSQIGLQSAVWLSQPVGAVATAGDDGSLILWQAP